MRGRATPVGDGWYAYQKPQPRKNGARRKTQYSIRRKFNPAPPRTGVQQPTFQSLVPTPIPHQVNIRTKAITNSINQTPPTHHSHLLPQPHYTGALTMHLSHTKPMSTPTAITRPQNPIQHPTYQSVLLSQVPDQNAFRFHQPIWHYFINNNPWSQMLMNPRTIPQPLPLPPDPTHPAWRGRCFNCLIFGHDQNDYRETERVCAICWQQGHQAKYCRGLPAEEDLRIDPLEPTGNLGDAALPANRPERLNVFIPETPSLRTDTQDLQQAVVIDARLKPNHTANKLQAILMTVCQVEAPFRITQLTGHQYLVLLPQNSDRKAFLDDYSNQLHGFGYVPYQWTPSTNREVLELRYKVWLEMEMKTPLGWNIECLLPVTSAFGALLDHTALTNARSIHNLTAVVAVPNLQEIPHEVRMWIRGVAWVVQIRVKGWVEETFQFPQHDDTTPPEQLFNTVAETNSQGMINEQVGNRLVPIDFDILFDVWERMEPGEHRDKLETTLRASKCYEVKEKQLLLANLREERERQAAAAADAAEDAAKQTAKGKKPAQLDESGSSATGGKIRATKSTKDMASGNVSINKVHAAPYPQNQGMLSGATAPVTSQLREAKRDTQKVHLQPRVEGKDAVAIKKPKGATESDQTEGQWEWIKKGQSSQAQVQNRPTPALDSGPCQENLLNSAPITTGLPLRPFEKVDLLHNPVLEAHIDSLINQQNNHYEDMEAQEGIEPNANSGGKEEGRASPAKGDQLLLNAIAAAEIDSAHTTVETEMAREAQHEGQTHDADMAEAEVDLAGEDEAMDEDGTAKEMVDGLSDLDKEYEEACVGYDGVTDDEQELAIDNVNPVTTVDKEVE